MRIIGNGFQKMRESVHRIFVDVIHANEAKELEKATRSCYSVVDSQIKNQDKIHEAKATRQRKSRRNRTSR